MYTWTKQYILTSSVAGYSVHWLWLISGDFQKNRSSFSANWILEINLPFPQFFTFHDYQIKILTNVALKGQRYVPTTNTLRCVPAAH